ncbi:hypothetical protein ODJ79_35830 [Actinoplanes sp. KI2]|uniref:hypothetical protein n=1 Tax=Actinoplanes sp. KI2 TaxID=2983315 RepID=UPI0021D5FEFD|nr:hypothetical protein [Actinoplanes sp. KI2]MCU7729114.1 hypothetical protein [Actinoplanes sp. KI2]
MSTAAQSSSEPESLLADIAALRRTVRRDRHAYWLPLLVFGVLALASAPFYVDPAGPDVLRAPRQGPALTGLGGDLLRHSTGIGWFWLAALIGGFLVSLWWYRRHALRAGVQTPTRSYAKAGIAGVVVGLGLGPALGWLGTNAWSPLSDASRSVLWPVSVLLGLGLAPLAVAGIGFLVLARLERSRLLAVVAGAVLVTLLLGPVYVNTVFIGSAYGYLPVVIVPGLVLLAGGVAGLARQGRK